LRAAREGALLLDVELRQRADGEVLPVRGPDLGHVRGPRSLQALLVLRERGRRIVIVADALLERSGRGLLDLALLHEQLRGALLAGLQIIELDRHLLELLVLLGGERAVLLLGVLTELVHLSEHALALL
jgi:hypothetical protein